MVFAAGWRMCPPQNAVAGGSGALLLFILHPHFLPEFEDSSPWTPFFVMFFTAPARDGELVPFIASWVLAGVFALDCGVGSSFVFWAWSPWSVGRL